MSVERWERAEKESDFTGMDFYVDIVKLKNSGVREVIVIDKNGNRIKISSQSTYSYLDVMIPAKPTMVKRWRVGGFIEVAGRKTEIQEFFKHEYEATSYLSALTEHYGNTDFSVDEVEVVSEDGE